MPFPSLDKRADQAPTWPGPDPILRKPVLHRRGLLFPLQHWTSRLSREGTALLSWLPQWYCLLYQLRKRPKKLPSEAVAMLYAGNLLGRRPLALEEFFRIHIIL